MVLAFVLKFVVSFIAIASLLLFISSIIGGIVNPQIVADDEGNIIDARRNGRIWLGLITSIFWALFFAL